MADGKVRISAVLDTEQAEKAAKAFQDRILTISTAMTKAVDTSMKQLDSQFSKIDKTMTTKSTSNLTKTINANSDAYDKNTLRLQRQENSARRVQQATERLNQANQRLQISQERINKSLDGSVTSSDKARSSFGSLGNAFQNLTNRIIAYGAISALQNFGRQLIEVTGQFEQTRIALGAIIGDMDEAQRQFDLIQQQALKSPFSIMELTDTTKMLAAYGYEASELNSTMNMMADLSAGVGVEMSRIAYNMGQIRAQTVLTNRDARDFASAGIPILGALAEKYSDLEGRLISTGEVFDMVSARMVSAADVQEVLNDMVSEGGMFYQMQEQLADSLRGRVSNLTDAFHIMYDEIGTAGYGVLRGSVDVLISLVSNWEKVATVIFTVIGAYGAYRAAIYLMNAPLIKYIALSSRAALSTGTQAAALSKLAAANLATAKSQSILNKAMLSIKSLNPYAIATAAVIGLGIAIFAAYRNATQLQRELDNIEAEGKNELTSSIANFQRLADTISDTSRPIQETNKAFEDLKRVYGDILPPQTLQIEKIREMAGEYGILTAAITDAKNAEILRNQESAIVASFSEPIAEAEEDLRKYLEKQGAGDIGITQFYADVKKQIEDGTLDTAMSIEEQSKILEESFYKFTGIQLDFSEIATRTIDPLTGVSVAYETLNKNVSSFIEVSEKQQRELSKVRTEAENARGSFGDLADSYREITKEGGLADKAVENLISTTKDLTIDGITYDTKFEFDEAVTRANAAALISETEKAIKDQFQLEIDLGEASTLIDPTALTQQLVGVTESQKTAIYAIFNDLFKDIGGILPSNLVKVVNDSVKDAANAVGLSFDDIEKYLRNNEESTEQWSKKIVEGYGVAVSTLKEYETLNKIALEQGNEPVYSSEKIAEIRQEIELREYLINLYGLQEKKTEQSEEKEIKSLKSRVDMINRVRKAYEDIYKATGDAGKSAESVTKTFGESFSQLFRDSGIELSDIITFDDSEIFKQINKLGSTLQDIESKEYVAKVIEEYRIDIITTANKASLDQAQSELDSLIKNYELGLTLKEAGDFGNILKNILGETEGLDFNMNFDKFIENANTAINKVKQELSDIDYEGRVEALETSLATASTDEQRAAIQNELDAYKKAYADRVKFVESGEKEIEKISVDYANKRIEHYNELLKKESSLSNRRVQVEKNTQKDIQNIAEDSIRMISEEGIDVSSLQNIDIKSPKGLQDYIDNLGELSEESISAKVALELISVVLGNQKSDLLELSSEYQSFFSSINTMSKESAANTKLLITTDLFEQFRRGALSVDQLSEQLRAVERQYKKVNEQQSIFLAYLEGGLDGAISLIEDYASSLSSVASRVAGSGSVANVSQDDKNYIDKMLGLFGNGQTGGSFSEMSSKFGGDVGKMGEGLQNVSSGMQGAMGSAAGVVAIIDIIVKNIDGLITGIRETVDLLNQARSEQNKIDAGWFEYFEEQNKYVTQAWDQLKSGNILGSFISSINVIISQFVMFSNKANEEITKGIEDSQYAVSRLEQEYTQLERAVENSLGSAEIAAKRQLILNKELVQSELEKQLALAQSREDKQYDQDEVDDLLDELQGVKNDIADITQSITDDVFGSVKDIASSTAEVWLEMWRNGEDALQGIRSSFQDTMQQMIVDAIMAKAIEDEVAKIWKGVESALEDNIIDESEWKKINDDIESGSVRMDEILKKLAETYGIAFGEGVDEENATSGLQRGIQNLTEETALALEGLLAIVVSNSFINMGNIEKIAQCQLALLAVNNQMLYEIRQGNITRRSMLTIMQAITDPSGVTPVNVKLI